MEPPLSSEAFNKINFLFLLTGRQELQHLIENRNAISKQAVHPLNYFISKNFETCHKSYFLTHFFLSLYFISNLWFHTFEVFRFTFKSSPNLCVHSSSSYVSPSMLPLSSGDLIEWSLVCHSTLSYQKFCDRHSNHYDHPEELHQSVE